MCRRLISTKVDAQLDKLGRGWSAYNSLGFICNGWYLFSCPENTHNHTYNGPLSGTTRVSQYQKGKTKLDFTEATDSEWQWHQLGHMQVCTSLQTDNHASTPPLSFLQALKAH